MTPILDNAVMTADLDFQNYDLKNIGMMDPVPDNLVATDDIRLTGGRVPAPGSITDDSVNDAAAIDQSKLSLNGVMPTAWLGTAAHGDLAEFLSRKGAPNGYAGLDANGKITGSTVDAGTAIGSVTSVGLSMFPSTALHVTSAVVTESGTLAMAWQPAPQNSWFGSDGTVTNDFIYPFYVHGPIDNGLLVGLPASKFTSGVFAVARLPIAKPMGSTTPRQGMVPDTGANGSGLMYLGRDMQWHHFVVNDPALAYQPKVPDVTIVLDWWDTDEIHITIRSLLKGSFLFYRVTPSGGTPPPFKEAHHPATPDDAHITLKVNEHDFIEAYAARQGYTTSDVEEWEVITPITDLGLS